MQALSGAQDSPAQKYITEKINNLDVEKTQLLQKKDELEKLLKNQGLSQLEFDNVKNLALSFGHTFDTMNVDQKRKALRTLVNKIVWDGENVHLYLFGSTDDKLPARVIDFLEPQREDSKFYPHATDDQVEGWHPIFKINSNLIVMAKHELKNTVYTLHYKHTFSFVTPRQLLESEIFNIRYKTTNDIHTVAERLRYYRHKKALRQKDVAKQIGISLSTYMSYEDVNRELYPIDVLKKIAAFYEVDVIEIMDEYHLFLYREQGLQLKNLINDLKLTPKAVAKKLNVHAKSVAAWESGKVRMSKSMYIKIFEDNILSQS